MTNEWEQLNFFQDFACGRTCRVRCHLTGGAILPRSWKSWQGSSNRESMFLNLKSGEQADASSETTGASPGESSTRSSSDLRKEDEEFVSWLTSMDCPLRQSYLSKRNTSEAPENPIEVEISTVLEWCVDEKYNLSVTACKGILRRSQIKRKTIPDILVEALNETILSSQEQDVRGG